MKRNLFIFLPLIPILLSGCGQDDYAGPAQTPYVKPPVINTRPAAEKKKLPPYVYTGDRFRDPFIPINSEGVSFPDENDVSVPNIGGLTLRGILDDGKQKIAIISGGGVTYLLKGSHLYDSRQRLVKGISGVIKTETVLIIAPDKTTRELKLRDRN